MTYDSTGLIQTRGGFELVWWD